VPFVYTNGDVHTESQFILDAQGSCDMELHERSFWYGRDAASNLLNGPF
jgi:hypothetical protein